MNKILKNALILTAITLVAGLCLGFVYDITKGPIAEEQQRAKREAYQKVCPEMASMERVVYPDMDIPAEEMEQEEKAVVINTDVASVMAAEGTDDIKVEEVYLTRDESGAPVGAVMNLTTTGYGGDINFSIGFQKDGTINGIEILSISETAGLGMRATEEEFRGQFAGKNVENFVLTKTGAQADNEIDALSGATITSTGMVRGVNVAVYYFRTMAEGGVFNE